MRNSKKFLTARQVSEYLGIPLRTVQHLSKQGKVKSIKIGSRWKYMYEDIERYFSQGTDFSCEPARKPNNFIERTDRRLYPRINSNFDCLYSINLAPFKEISSNGIIKDLSAGGVFIYNNELNKIDINDPVDLRFVLVSDNNQNIDIKTNGRIVRKTQNGLGIKFKNIDEELKNRIIEYVG